MSQSTFHESSKASVVSRYLIAWLSVVAAVVISRVPAFHLQAAPVSLLLCAIMFSAWFCGLGPGLLAVVLSSLTFDYYFLEPQFSLGLRPENIRRFVMFCLASLFGTGLSVLQRRTTESFRHARDELRGMLDDLQKTNQADGMGLGLSISRRIIEEHGGKMWATLNEPRGTLVQFTLPAENKGVL
jgi:K+-sensing histidine kinase KdpD